MAPPPDRRVAVGRVAGLFGVRGWVKVYSYTRPREAILNYRPWLIEHDGAWREFGVADGRVHGRGIVAQLDGCTDRDAMAPLVGAEIAVLVSQLPEVGKNEYYWAELEGLRVVNLGGDELGQVSHLFETGANDVMVVRGERERLIPFDRGVVRRVDRKDGVIHVDWDADN
jgi:16S rRNA processing protein RimM